MINAGEVKNVFNKGDKVVYPLYGAGIIEDLECKSVDGQDQMYYVLKIPIGNLKIMISAKKAEGLGIRRVMNAAELERVICGVKIVQMSENWNQRYKDNMDKIKTGNLDEVAEVFMTLRERERAKGLSSAEKKLLSTAKQIILSEMILSFEMERSEAEEMLNRTIS